MNETFTRDQLRRLQCGELGDGLVEWRGMNMLTVTYDEDEEATESIDMNGDHAGEGRCIQPVEDDIAESRSDDNRSVSRTESRSANEPLSRDAVLERLRRRTEERLQRNNVRERVASKLLKGLSP